MDSANTENIVEKKIVISPVKRRHKKSEESQEELERKLKILGETSFGTEYVFNGKDLLYWALNGQLGISEMLKTFYNGRYLLEKDGKSEQVYEFNGIIWEKDTKCTYIDFDNRILQLLKEAYVYIPEKYEQQYLKALEICKNVDVFERVAKKAMKGRDGFIISSSQWDNDIHTITTPQGIVDLTNGNIRDVLPEDYRRKCTKVSLYEKDIIGEPTLWLKTLNEIFLPIGMPEEPDYSVVETEEKYYERAKARSSFVDTDLQIQREKLDECRRNYNKNMEIYHEELEKWQNGTYIREMIEFFQILLGSTLHGENKDQIFVIFYGNQGRNGKGVILHTLKGILGEDYVIDARSETFLRTRARDSGSATPELLRMKGGRIVEIEENNRGDMLDSCFVKRFTGGDSISGRRLYGEEEVFKPSAIPILATNYLPHFDSDDAALYKRLVAIPFLRTFSADIDDKDVTLLVGKLNPDLQEQLKEEYPAIFRWLVDGAVKYHNMGRLVIPDFIKKITDDTRNERDQLEEFFSECCEIGDKLKEESSVFHLTFNQWQSESGFNRWNRNLFRTRMIAKGFSSVKNSTMMFKGIELNNEGRDLYQNAMLKHRPNQKC